MVDAADEYVSKIEAGAHSLNGGSNERLILNSKCRRFEKLLDILCDAFDGQSIYSRQHPNKFAKDDRVDEQRNVRGSMCANKR